MLVLASSWLFLRFDLRRLYAKASLCYRDLDLSRAGLNCCKQGWDLLDPRLGPLDGGDEGKDAVDSCRLDRAAESAGPIGGTRTTPPNENFQQ